MQKTSPDFTKKKETVSALSKTYLKLKTKSLQRIAAKINSNVWKKFLWKVIQSLNKGETKV